MTTTEPLQFSVITAPLAAIDRRALSQAWYSALYRQNAPQRAGRATATGAALNARVRAHAALPRESIAPRHSTLSESRSATGTQPMRAEGATERRQMRCALARKIERVFLQRSDKPTSATFRISGVPGRVHVILREGTRGLQLVAVCSRSARAHVAAALEQARYALAARGIAVSAQLRCEASAC